MEGFFEVNDALATLTLASSEILANLPVHGGLEGVLNGLSTSLNKEKVLELSRHGYALKSSNELSHGNSVDVRVRWVVESNLSDFFTEFRVVHLGVIVSNGLGCEHRKAIKVFLASA
jgi:hypothetical protein